MSQNRNKNDDPAGCRPALREARLALRQAGSSTQGEWCALAVALGRCRLFGVEPGDDLDGTLKVTQARTAASELARELADCAARGKVLGEKWDRTSDPDEALELVCSLLEDRLDAWAALVALDEAYEAGLADGAPGLEDLVSDLERVMDALDRFDESLEGHLALLSLATATPLLDNWRAWLAPEFAEERPWWLDGRLEEAARKVEAVASAASPTPAQLVRLREQTGAAWEWLPELRMAASVPNGEPVHYRDWISPSGTHSATLAVTSVADRVQVMFFRGDDDATELAGQPAELGGVASTIDPRASAYFAVRDLRQARAAGSPEMLSVAGIVWRLAPTEEKP
jgi:hypothetical protein